MTFEEIAVQFLKAVTAELDPYTSQKGVIQTDGSKVVLFTPAHIQFAIYGRGPGKQPPYDTILAWVKKESITFTDSTQEGTAWAIAKKIAREGTKNWVPNAPNALQEALNFNMEKYVEDVNRQVIELTTERLDNLYEDEFPNKVEFKI